MKKKKSEKKHQEEMMQEYVRSMAYLAENLLKINKEMGKILEPTNTAHHNADNIKAV